jgi:hypothetical protein
VLATGLRRKNTHTLFLRSIGGISIRVQQQVVIVTYMNELVSSEQQTCHKAIHVH